MVSVEVLPSPAQDLADCHPPLPTESRGVLPILQARLALHEGHGRRAPPCLPPHRAARIPQVSSAKPLRRQAAIHTCVPPGCLPTRRFTGSPAGRRSVRQLSCRCVASDGVTHSSCITLDRIAPSIPLAQEIFVAFLTDRRVSLMRAFLRRAAGCRRFDFYSTPRKRNEPRRYSTRARPCSGNHSKTHARGVSARKARAAGTLRGVSTAQQHCTLVTEQRRASGEAINQNVFTNKLPPTKISKIFGTTHRNIDINFPQALIERDCSNDLHSIKNIILSNLDRFT